MATFAQRMGFKETRSLMQLEDLDTETRTELWNLMVLLREELNRGIVDPQQEKVLSAVWEGHLKRARDERPGATTIWGYLKQIILKGEWYDVLDLIEAVVKYLERYPSGYSRDRASMIVRAFNNRFEHYLVGYRFIGLELTPVGSTLEASAVSTAFDSAADLAGVRHHLDRATELLSDRQAPDYPNSIKESISAVEAVVKIVTAEGTLGKGLSKLEASGLVLHGALKASWSQMYGWVSDDDGIRHGGIDPAKADQGLARYVLVTCAAFVSYLIEEGRKLDLI
ncbi:hypothetical protein ITJ62_02645 [Plantibacter sp. VKM Ac-2876]|nr:hypothetical protein [Plantibacter sp. VKM Ac-2876]